MTLEESVSIAEDLFIVSKSREVTSKLMRAIMDANKDLKTEVYDFKDYSKLANKDTELLVLTNYDSSLNYTVRVKILDARTSRVRVIVLSETIDDSVMFNFKAHILCKVEDTSEILLIRGIRVDKIKVN